MLHLSLQDVANGTFFEEPLGKISEDNFEIGEFLFVAVVDNEVGLEGSEPGDVLEFAEEIVSDAFIEIIVIVAQFEHLVLVLLLCEAPNDTTRQISADILIVVLVHRLTVAVAFGDSLLLDVDFEFKFCIIVRKRIIISPDLMGAQRILLQGKEFLEWKFITLLSFERVFFEKEIAGG